MASSSSSSPSSTAANRDGSASAAEDEAVMSVTRAFAQDALLQFQSGKWWLFAECRILLPKDNMATPTEETIAAPIQDKMASPIEEPMGARPWSAPVEEPISALAEESISAPAEEPMAAPAEEPMAVHAEEPMAAPIEELMAAPVEELMASPPLTTPINHKRATPDEDMMETPDEEKMLLLTLFEDKTATPYENNEVENTETQPNKRRKKKSIVWEHFTIKNVGPGCRRACCKQCKQSFAYSTGSKVAGTSHLKHHIAKGTCPALLRNQNMLESISQDQDLSHIKHNQESIKPFEYELMYSH
ncbi:unnamed protein product [Malus baccata var. baccata]